VNCSLLLHRKLWTNLIRPQFIVDKQRSPKFNEPSAMKRRELISTLISTSVFHHASARAKESSDAAPRWKFLGDDDALRETIKEAGQVLLVCVFQTSLDRVKPPFSDVVLRATVVQTVKGTHTLGDRITIRFNTDSLPIDEAARAKFIEDVAAKNLGSLKLAFLRGARSDDYGSEWLYVPAYDPDMPAFAAKNSR